MLKAAGATSAVIKHQRDEGLTVVDFIGVDKGESFGESETEDFNIFVRFGGRGTLADASGEVDLHPLAEEAGAGEVFCQQGPALSAIAGLFNQFAFGGGKGRFVGFDTAGGEFDKREAGGVTVLALEDDVGVAGVLRLVDREHDDRAVVADDVAGVDVTAGLLNLVSDDGEDPAFEGQFGGDKAWFVG